MDEKPQPIAALLAPNVTDDAYSGAVNGILAARRTNGSIPYQYNAVLDNCAPDLADRFRMLITDKAVLMATHRAKFPDNRMRSICKEYYDWKTYENPIMQGFIFLEEREGVVAGSGTVMPKKIAILDEVVSAAETGDAFTLPEWRRQGINTRALKKLIEYAVSQGMNVIYGPPNEANYRSHIKLGYMPCTYVRWALLTKSLNPGRDAIRLIGKIVLGKNILKNGRQLRYLERRIGLKGQGTGPCKKYEESDFQIVTIDKFRDIGDPLWGKPRYSFFVVRDSQYLNWRYFQNPDKFTVLAAVKDRKYLGYVAVKMVKDNSTGIMCDFVTVNDRSDVFVALVKEAEKIVRGNSAKAIALRCIADSPYYSELKEMGYYDPGPERYHRVHIYGETELGKRILNNVGKWHFTYGDTDEV